MSRYYAIRAIRDCQKPGCAKPGDWKLIDGMRGSIGDWCERHAEEKAEELNAANEATWTTGGKG